MRREGRENTVSCRQAWCFHLPVQIVLAEIQEFIGCCSGWPYGLAMIGYICPTKCGQMDFWSASCKQLFYQHLQKSSMRIENFKFNRGEGSYWNPACENSCGDTPACEIGAATAYEQIEERINFNYLANNNPCPNNYTFVGWVNIVGPIYVEPQAFTEGELKEDCSSAFGQQIGTCMEWEELNCVYCSIYGQIGQTPFAIHFDDVSF